MELNTYDSSGKNLIEQMKKQGATIQQLVDIIVNFKYERTKMEYILDPKK